MVISVGSTVSSRSMAFVLELDILLGICKYGFFSCSCKYEDCGECEKERELKARTETCLASQYA